MLHTYGAAMDACASAGQLDRALEVAAWMEEGGHPLNRVAYTTLIKVRYRCAGKVSLCGVDGRINMGHHQINIHRGTL